MKKTLTGLGILLASLPVFAATPVDLSRQPITFLAQFSRTSGMAMSEVSRTIDFNKTLHVRMKQTYQGYAVWGGDAIVHTPKTLHPFMNGLVYQNLQQDLANVPSYVFDATYKQKVMTHVASLYQVAHGQSVDHEQGQLMIYVDEVNKAHWAFHVIIDVAANERGMPEKQIYIVDAIHLTVYQQWNDIQTLDNVEAGGFGGNHKTGQKMFDGLDDHQPKLSMQRDAATSLCLMQNSEVVVRDYRNRNNAVRFDCKVTDPEHNNIYWNGSFDAIETTWSPSNDALFGAQVTSGMFKTWYNMPMLIKNGKPMFLPITVHDPVENAYWDGEQVVFGDSRGSSTFNPFTQLDTVAHEIAHGFTEQHSGLVYSSQSGGLNEAFSDMAGIAAEFYAYGKTQYLVGYGDMKEDNVALRYMEKPSKDCGKRKPGDWCSIDHMNQYYYGLDVHYSSGIFNRVYYNLANTPGWDARKAFDVMVQANVNYWTPNTSFASAACGVMKATKDYKYDLTAVSQAFSVVGIDTSRCA